MWLGRGLSGATVKVQGKNAVVSGADGAFSMVVSGQSFLLEQVKKNGY